MLRDMNTASCYFWAYKTNDINVAVSIAIWTQKCHCIYQSMNVHSYLESQRVRMNIHVSYALRNVNKLT